MSFSEPSSKLKLSRYLVNVPFTDNEGKAMQLLHQLMTEKSAVVSELDWKRLHEINQQKISPDLAEIASNIGAFTPEEHDEFELAIKQNIEACNSPGVLFRTIFPTGNCQFSCNDPDGASYCGQCHVNKTLSKDHQLLLVKNLEKDIKTGKYSKLRIAWMGGEPLLALDVITSISKEIIPICAKYGVEYNSEVTTNGFTLNVETAKILHLECKVNEFALTLDGTKDYHDQRRCLKSGKGPTFDRIFSNILAMSQEPTLKDAQVMLRCNTDSRNKESVFSLIDKLKEHQLQDFVSFYTALVRPWGNDISSFEMSIEEYAQFEIDVYKRLIEYGFKISVLPTRTTRNCTAVQNNAFIIDPFGGYYKCSELPLLKGKGDSPSDNPNLERVYDCNVGDVHRGMKKHKENKRIFEDFNHTLADKECRDCQVLPVCGGGCPIMWEHGYESCPSTRYNIKDRLLLAYQMKRSGSQNIEESK